jgi:hypothetical protein
MRRRGYSLPLVLLVLTMLGLAMVSLTTVLADSARTSGSLAARRRTMYACDGVVRALAVQAGEYFKTASLPNTSDLRQAICGNRSGPGCPRAAGWMPDFTLSSVDVSTGAVNVLREIPNGPFAGQTSRRTDLVLGVEMIHKSGRTCRVSQRMVNGQIGLFQFAVFSGVPMDLFNPPPMTLTGRTHINADFCAGGTGRALTIERLTVSGRILSGCHGGAKFLIPTGSISTDGFFAVKKTNPSDRPLLSSTNDNDGSSEAAWRAEALDRWQGNVMDQAHEVPSLRLPVATASSAQPGNNQDGTPETNIETLRVMVDPLRPGDAAQTAAERLFRKADLRIINGIWYLRDGTVIWSDHSGTVNALQEELSLGVPATIPALLPGPKRYSYYERSGETINNDPAVDSVISYGTLFRQSDTRWIPGVAQDATSVRAANLGNAVDLVNGTRTGFVDRRVALAPSSEVASRILPVNFDVAAFTAAMRSTTDRELGSHFNGGARFNGIVWIGNSWPGHDDGFTGSRTSTTLAAFAPGRALDANGLYALPPLPLCRNTSGGADLATGRAQAACGDTELPRINAVRVINASVVDPDVFPRGLTIASNGPVYSLGNINTGSLNGIVPGVPRIDSPTGRWVPVLLAGDAYTLLSTSWTDRTANPLGQDRTWGVPPREVRFCPTPDAGPTTVVSAILAGHVDTASTWGGGINNFPRFIECWDNVENRIIGSLVIGFRSVYQRQRYHLFSYRPPDRLWGFDPNLESPARQPPGTPVFFVQAVERWERD